MNKEKLIQQNMITLLERAAEEIENCYGRDTELTNEIRDTLQNVFNDNKNIIQKIDEEIHTVLHTEIYSLSTENYRLGVINGLRKVKGFIQSEPEEKQTSLFFECPKCHTQAGLDLAHQEKTNFDVITESPEMLAKYLWKLTGYQSECNNTNFLNWLNEKAGE